jgi:hypothetical protein
MRTGASSSPLAFPEAWDDSMYALGKRGAPDQTMHQAVRHHTEFPNALCTFISLFMYNLCTKLYFAGDPSVPCRESFISLLVYQTTNDD